MLKMSTEKKHLPLYGIGPLYVAIIILLTAVGIILSECGAISGKFAILKTPMLILGVLFIIDGLRIWLTAAFGSRIDKHISDNELVTSGIYSRTRNPLYTGWAFLCIGSLLLEGNVWLMVLPNVFIILLALMMKKTEEKWLTELYGEQYLQYAQRVPRFWPTLGPAKPVRMYRSNISLLLWWVCDILGNLGWIAYLAALVMFLNQGEAKLWSLLILLLIAVGIPASLTEIITERIDKLDWALPEIRLRRGFGLCSLSSMAGWIISLVLLFIDGISLPLTMMNVGALACTLFVSLIYLKYKKE